MTAPSAAPLLIGVGNPSAATTVWVCRHSPPARPESPGFTIVEETGDGAELLEAWKGASAVILAGCGAIRVAPGTIHRLDAATEKLPRVFPLFHARLRSGRSHRNLRAPSANCLLLSLFTASKASIFRWTSLSPEVAASVPGVVSSILGRNPRACRPQVRAHRLSRDSSHGTCCGP